MILRFFLLFVSMLLIIVAVFELHPAVQKNRAFISEEIFLKKNCDCGCILASRPWYSIFNYWFWLFLIVPPLCAFSLMFKIKKSHMILIAFFCACFSYILLNLATNLSWDIRNAPFVIPSNLSITSQKILDIECANIADGASVVFTMLFGWIPAFLYTGAWFFIWSKSIYFFNKRNTLLS